MNFQNPDVNIVKDKKLYPIDEWHASKQAISTICNEARRQFDYIKANFNQEYTTDIICDNNEKSAVYELSVTYNLPNVYCAYKYNKDIALEQLAEWMRTDKIYVKKGGYLDEESENTLWKRDEETDEIIATFTETVELIELEKERVVRGLEDMQVIKENFENQCIQSCMNIRTELERLDKLSVITMEDEQIPIMKLRIPYVDEEQYRDRMSEYIDNIAAMTDSYDSNEEKLKYLRNNLCWKKLFSVIVTDMNGIRLNLYKRERIAGQSRYLPYEEAVGSTGQSQGIYIQFLISIINYISSINSKSSDATRLKKTIFIDNPFGAAKDIYIWEPIFKLLKTNNVQLIVPARGATPAITGRFDVNYILGQKMCNGKQQTVVYYSNVENDSLEYTTLSYEQTSLF